MTASLTCKPKAPASEVTAAIARRTIPASTRRDWQVCRYGGRAMRAHRRALTTAIEDVREDVIHHSATPNHFGDLVSYYQNLPLIPVIRHQMSAQEAASVAPFHPPQFGYERMLLVLVGRSRSGSVKSNGHRKSGSVESQDRETQSSTKLILFSRKQPARSSERLVSSRHQPSLSKTTQRRRFEACQWQTMRANRGSRGAGWSADGTAERVWCEGSFVYRSWLLTAMS
jgi:hypothetical protein